MVSNFSVMFLCPARYTPQQRDNLNYPFLATIFATTHGRLPAAGKGRAPAVREEFAFNNGTVNHPGSSNHLSI